MKEIAIKIVISLSLFFVLIFNKDLVDFKTAFDIINIFVPVFFPLFISVLLGVNFDFIKNSDMYEEFTDEIDSLRKKAFELFYIYLVSTSLFIINMDFCWRGYSINQIKNTLILSFDIGFILFSYIQLVNNLNQFYQTISRWKKDARKPKD